MDSSMEKENTTLPKQARFMKVISMKIRFMEVDLCFGLTVLNTKENIDMVKWKVME
jgi:hypothetical protein